MPGAVPGAEPASLLSAQLRRHEQPGPSFRVLGPASCWEQKPRDLRARFGEPWYHLKAQPAGPFPKAFTNRRMRPTQYWFHPIPIRVPRLCYNRRAVERAAKWEPVRAQADPAQAASESVAPSRDSQSPVARTNILRGICPVCSQRLECGCKLICSRMRLLYVLPDYY